MGTLSDLVTQAGAPGELLPALVKAATELVGADGAAIVQVSRSGLAVIVASQNLPPAFGTWRAEVEALDDALSRELTSLSGGAFAEARTLPLMSGGDLFGALVLFFARPAELAGARLRNAEALCELAAISLGRAFQHEELARAYQELRAARATLERTQKLRALGQMAAGVSHDLKNILNPLSLHLQLLRRILVRRGGDAGADALEAVGEMEQVVRRGVEVVERIRDFSRQSVESSLDTVDLNPLVAEAGELARPRLSSSLEARRIRLVQELGEVVPVRLRRAELVTAVLNLVVNAIDAMKDGGTITLTTGARDGGAWVRVADDGPGMAPEVEARIFEPFFTTKGVEGTGLGLAMVYAMVQRHAGTIALDTAPGQGAAFTLWFPAAAGAEG